MNPPTYDYGESIQDRDLRALKARLAASETVENERKRKAIEKERLADGAACWRARQSQTPTRHIVRFNDRHLGLIRRAIQGAARDASLSSILDLVDAPRDEVDRSIESIRLPFETDHELKRRLGYAFTCWAGVAVVSLPEMKLVAVRGKAR